MRIADKTSKRKAPRKRTVLMLLLLAILVAVTSSIYLAKPRKPISNTKEYRVAHGVVDGHVSELRIKGIRFRFPATYRVEPETGGEIVRGQADRVLWYVDMSFLLPAKPGASFNGYGTVRIELHARGQEHVQDRWARLTGPGWKSIRERADFGMHEYVDASGFGGWGYIVYAGSDPRWRTPKGGPIIFNCVGLRDQAPSQCRTGYEHPRGPFVEYYLPSDLLPFWRQVHAEVARQVDSFIVE